MIASRITRFMLANRVIPVILIDGTEIVKGKSFQSWRRIGHPAQAFRVLKARRCDEIIVLDVKATRENRGPDFEERLREAMDVDQMIEDCK